jgi:transposase
MSRYVNYNPDQDWLLPPSLREELGAGHLAVFIHEVVERLDLGQFESEASEQGRPAYPPQMMLKLWLYGYAVGLTSSRRLEQRVREDLGFRFLAANLKPDYWVLNEFRKKHPKALNDVFTQVVEMARQLGMGKLGRVAIDSTRVAANASRDRTATIEQLRKERTKVRRKIRAWQKQCDRDSNEDTVASVEMNDLNRRLEEIPRQMQELKKSGQKRVSRTDPESRYLRQRGGFVLGYTAEVAVSEDHLIVAQRVHQGVNDAGSLADMTEALERETGQRPATVLADSGYYSMPHIRTVQQRGIEVLVPDNVLAQELRGGPVVHMNARQQKRTPGLLELRERLRDPIIQAVYRTRKAIVEPVFGVLKQQRAIRQFRTRGVARVAVEWSLATTAFNITRLFTACCA